MKPLQFENVCKALEELADSLTEPDFPVSETEIVEHLEGQIISGEDSGRLKMYFANKP